MDAATRSDDVDAAIEEVLTTFPVLRERHAAPAADLSGGQQQMLALGMAFIAKPRVLLIDELSLGLAPVIVGQLLPIVRRLADDGVAVILVEQSVNVALTVGRAGVLHGARHASGSRDRRPSCSNRPDLLRSVFLSDIASRRRTPAIAAGRRQRSTSAGSRRCGHRARARSAASARSTTCRSTSASGEIVGIIGPNGAGKTTLFDLDQRVHAADAGRVVLGGHDITHDSAHRRAAGAGSGAASRTPGCSPT